MPGLQASLFCLKAGRQLDSVGVAPIGLEPGPGPAAGDVMRPVATRARGLTCLFAAPWDQLILGDDPVPGALLLLGYALLLLVFAHMGVPPILGIGSGLLLLVAVAVFRAWSWCRDTRCDEEA
jgi:hypothetical protein